MVPNANDRPILKIYRARAMWGGCALGALIGTLIGGPHVASWSEPVKSYSVYVLAGAVIGIILGYIFYALFLGGLSSGTADLGSRGHDDNTGDNPHSIPSAENEAHGSDISDGGHD
jgi:hypothetical protein